MFAKGNFLLKTKQLSVKVILQVLSLLFNGAFCLMNIVFICSYEMSTCCLAGSTPEIES